jgi:hypothetical protein
MNDAPVRRTSMREDGRACYGEYQPQRLVQRPESGLSYD